ncbi:MerR family transcriptional regulator [uncultured Marivita sp.]|uniref:MerR family transcriptional regulator n=1 Tax=uncultured Marivita sp. TaxID=888080 RepID=UPI0026080CFF|nr:MerR family transcriptional regulator [uncultured Marivita sp.]
MSKSADAFRTISEVAEWLDTPAHVLRFWESKFTQVKPVKRAGGRRYYRPADMRLLGGIKKLLHEDGMTIKGAQKVLREQGTKHVSSLCTLSLGDEEEDVAFVDMQTDVASEPVDTVVPFSKPEEEPEPAAVAEETEPDLLTEAPAAEAEPVVEVEKPVETASQGAPEPLDPAEPDIAEAAPAPIEPAPIEDVSSDGDDAPALVAGDTTTEEPEMAESQTTPEEAETLPGFLQHSMAERSAESHADADSEAPTDSPAQEPEPEEPVPGTLTHLSRITRLSPELAQQIAPVLDRLREVAR